MELIDWRALYAANRAVIEGRGVPADPATEGVAVARPALLPGPGAFGPAARLPGPAVSLPGLRLPGTRTVRRSRGHRPTSVEHHDGRRARPVRVHVPDGLDPATAAPLVVALHGCTQTAATFAAGALLDQEADRHGFVVAYPEQVREDNPQGCWNWFTAEHQSRGARRARVPRRRDARRHGRGVAMDDRPAARVRRRDVGRRRDGIGARGHPSRRLLGGGRALGPGLRLRPHPPVGDAGDAARGPGSRGAGPRGLRRDGPRRPRRSRPRRPRHRRPGRVPGQRGARASVSGWRRTGSPAATPPTSRARTRSSATTPPGGCR